MWVFLNLLQKRVHVLFLIGYLRVWVYLRDARLWYN